MSTEIGKRLRSLRKAQGLSQEAVARQTRVGLKAYGDLERGRTVDPHYSTLEDAARALGVTVAELISEGAEASNTGKAPAPTASGQHETGSSDKGAGDPAEAARRIQALPSTAAELASAWNRDVEFYEQHDRSLRPYRTLEMGLAVEGLYQHFWRELSVLQRHAESLDADPNPATWEPQSKELLIEAGSNIHALAELYAVIKQAAADRRGTREDWRALREEFDVKAPAQEPAFLTEDPQWPAAIERARAAAGIA
jgi:transcriptional regulator with XRE-family HTH domain